MWSRCDSRRTGYGPSRTRCRFGASRLLSTSGIADCGIAIQECIPICMCVYSRKGNNRCVYLFLSLLIPLTIIVLQDCIPSFHHSVIHSTHVPPPLSLFVCVCVCVCVFVLADVCATVPDEPPEKGSLCLLLSCE